ncbi:glutathione S-transferase family protein [Marivita sp. S2033]|uniref:glutathione S-transferase family protein n=1 Tax=Marivita sp. S2033 TaxID=3373187 RepID=UPI0039820EF7
MLTLYYSKASSALAPHILLQEVGATYAVHEVPIDKGAQHDTAFLKVNPKARVPALMTPEGVITENPAILGYIAATHPHANMLPDTPFERARADELNAYLCATMHVAYAHLLRGARWVDDEAAQNAMKNKVASNIADCATMIETHYLKGPWALGEHYTMCDAYLMMVPLWMKKAGVDLVNYPRIATHHRAMLDRPATLSVMAVHGL